MEIKTLVVRDLEDMVSISNKNINWCIHRFRKHRKSIKRLTVAGFVVSLYFNLKMSSQEKKIDELSRQIKELKEEQEEE